MGAGRGGGGGKTSLTDPVEVVLPDEPYAVLREVPSRRCARAHRREHPAQAPSPDARVDRRAPRVSPTDEAFLRGVAVAIALPPGRGAVAVHVRSQVRVPGADVIPGGAGGVVEAVVVVELRGVPGVGRDLDGPVVRAAGGVGAGTNIDGGRE